jgi:hypothetical protein
MAFTSLGFEQVGIVLRQADGTMFIATVDEPQEIHFDIEEVHPDDWLYSRMHVILPGTIDIVLRLSDVRSYTVRWIYPDGHEEAKHGGSVREIESASPSDEG